MPVTSPPPRDDLSIYMVKFTGVELDALLEVVSKRLFTKVQFDKRPVLAVIKEKLDGARLFTRLHEDRSESESVET